jgi:hypothetical protein
VGFLSFQADKNMMLDLQRLGTKHLIHKEKVDKDPKVEVVE